MNEEEIVEDVLEAIEKEDVMLDVRQAVKLAEMPAVMLPEMGVVVAALEADLRLEVEDTEVVVALDHLILIIKYMLLDSVSEPPNKI